MQSTRRATRTLCALTDMKRLQAIERAVPMSAVDEVIRHFQCQEQRARKLRMCQVVYLMIAMSLIARERLALVLQRILLTWHWLQPIGTQAACAPTDSALHYRRAQLGVAPLVRLFHAVCRPLATYQTKGAFAFGLRLMAVDGKRLNLPDTPELDRYFGRPSTDRGDAAFPQALLVTLTELGTRACIDAGVWPLHTGEHKGLLRLLRSLTDDMLLLLDRGLYSVKALQRARQAGAHVLVRLPSNVKPHVVKTLPDGSQLVRVAPASHHPHKFTKKTDGMLVRLVTYTFIDPQNPGHRQVYRLITTLLDDRVAPAHALAQVYHERWQQEMAYDETEVHLLHGDAPLRSRSVRGALQEVYGILLAHYSIRLLIHEAAVRENLDPDEISFSGAVVLIQQSIAPLQLAGPEQRGRLIDRLLYDIAQQRVQRRSPRSYPRAVKRKMSNFPLRRNTASGYKTCKPYHESIALI